MADLTRTTNKDAAPEISPAPAQRASPPRCAQGGSALYHVDPLISAQMSSCEMWKTVCKERRTFFTANANILDISLPEPIIQNLPFVQLAGRER
jgi:hypothetical protein